MKKEVNNYSINNPDGSLRIYKNDGKTSYTNDAPGFVRENSAMGQNESFQSSETFDSRRSHRTSRRSTQTDRGTTDGSGLNENKTINESFSSSNLSSASGVTAATGQAATGVTASSTATVGMGAIAGTVATTVATTAIVIAIFISTLTINLSLTMANMDSLVFQIEMQGAQEQDFETPIYAILEDNDGYREEQLIGPNTVYLSFHGLVPDHEYLITVKNEEKTFFKKSYITASEYVEYGYISAWNEGTEVYGFVEHVILKPDEFYTITAKDAKGRTYFVKDSAEENLEFTFSVSEPVDLYLSLTVDGKVYAVSQVEMYFPEPEPQYDFYNASWTWAQDLSYAIFSAPAISGGQPLQLNADIDTEILSYPSCETDGSKLFTATVYANNVLYSDERTLFLSATGHAYGSPAFEWTPVYDPNGPSFSEVATVYGYTATATFTCANDPTHIHVEQANVTSAYTSSTCNDDGFNTYTAEVFFQNEHYWDEKIEVFENTALGHDYAEHEFIWTETPNGYSAVLKLICSRDESHFTEINAEVSSEQIDAQCDTDARVVYYASAQYNNDQFNDEREIILSDTAPGHDYEPVPEEPATSTAEGVAEHYICAVCEKLFDMEYNEVTIEDLIISPYNVEYDYSSPVWDWDTDDSGAPTGNVTVSFNEIHGEDPLVYNLSAQLMEKSAADCYNPMIAYYHADTSDLENIDNYESDSDEFEYGDPLGHDPELHEGTVTCDESGYITYYRCTRCEGYFDVNENEINEEDIYVEAIGHDYIEHLYELATCCTYGQVAKICNNCNKVIMTTVDPDDGFHDFRENESSSEVITCAYCGEPFYPTALYVDEDVISLFDGGYRYGDANNETYPTDGNLYTISGTHDGDALSIYTSSLSVQSDEKVTFHLIFDNLTITAADSDVSGAITVYVDRDADIFITNIGESHITTKQTPPITIRKTDANSDAVYTVNLYMVSEFGFETLFFDKADPENDQSEPVIGFEGQFKGLSYMNYQPIYQSAGSVGIRYLVLFDDGETVSHPVFVNDGDDMSSFELFEPEKAEYVFDGWYFDFEYSSPFDPNMTVECNMTLHAMWMIEHEHDLGELYPEEPASCENNGLAAHYCCSICYKYFDALEQEVSYEDLLIPELGHSYGDLITENYSENGLYAHYVCSICGKYFDTEFNETTLEDLMIPTTQDTILLTSENLSEDYIGMQVVLKTDDDSFGVQMGALNNTTDDMSDLSLFTIGAITDDRIVLYYETTDNYLSVASGSSIAFSGSDPNSFTVSADGSLSASDGVSTYDLRYDESGGSGIYFSATSDSGPAVYLYLLLQ